MRFWNITPCSPLKVNRRFGDDVQGRISRARYQREARCQTKWLMFYCCDWLRCQTAFVCIRYSCNVVCLLFARCAHNERVMRLYPIAHLFFFLSLLSPSCCSWMLGTYVKICCSNLCRFVSFQYELYFTTRSSLSSSIFLKNCSYCSRLYIQMDSAGMNPVEVAHV
jgi:hypothetical protein